MHLERRTVRLAAAGVSATMAVIYYLIGIGLLPVADEGAATDGLLVFGAMAGSAFLLGAALLLAFDRRVFWVLGFAFQIFVFWAYLSIAPQREPAFEMWGITLRLLQLPLIALLFYLVVRAPRSSPSQAHPTVHPRASAR
jgi:hypothetical protein